MKTFKANTSFKKKKGKIKCRHVIKPKHRTNLTSPKCSEEKYYVRIIVRADDEHDQFKLVSGLGYI